jgi:hypothetical protein
MSIITRTDPAAMRRIRKRMKQLGKKAAYVGLPDSTDGDLLMRGAVHNFGSVSQNIPARPWLTEGANEGVDKYKQVARNKVPRVMDGTMTVQNYYNLLGEIGKSEIQKYIRNGDFVPLAAATIEAKGSSKPLIDTGQMRNAVTYEVK